MIDFSDVETQSNDYELIPKGHYPVTGTDWEEKESQGRAYFTVTFTLFGEKYKGRKIFENFFIGEGFSEKAVAIGMGKIKSMLELQKESLKFDSYADLFNAILDKPMLASVGISKSKDPQYQDKNCIWSVKDIAELDSVVPSKESNVDMTSDVPF